MYLSHWRLSRSPFAGRLDLDRLFPSRTHQEALARLEFLVANRRPVGLLLGPGGSGKSLLLHQLAERLTRRGVRVARLSLVGTTPDDVLGRLAAELGCGDRADLALPKLWARISDRIAENRRLELSTAILCDDVDAATPELQSLVVRLVHADPSPHARHTLVLASNAARVDRIAERLFDLVDLRVDLDPWDEADTVEYVRTALAECGRSDDIIDAEAVAQIHELSGGIPRHINRLADLALVAAAGQHADRVDAETIAAVAGELVAC